MSEPKIRWVREGDKCYGYKYGKLVCILKSLWEVHDSDGGRWLYQHDSLESAQKFAERLEGVYERIENRVVNPMDVVGVSSIDTVTNHSAGRMYNKPIQNYLESIKEVTSSGMLPVISCYHILSSGTRIGLWSQVREHIKHGVFRRAE